MDERVVRISRLVVNEPARDDDSAGVPGVLRRVCSAAQRVLAASGVGVSVLVHDGMRGVAAVSEPSCYRLEELQFTLGEGPCVDAYTTRQPVLVPDIRDGAVQRWPGYGPALQEHGMKAVFAFPLQIGAARLGALDVFRSSPGALTDAEVRDALTFADVAVTALLDGQAQAPPGTAADGLDEVMDQRAELFQAQGMVAIQLGTSLTDALARLRAHAYAHDRSLGDVARDVVARRLSFDSGHS